MRRVLLAAVLLLTFNPCALALNPTLDVSQYIHTAWRVRDGFVKGAISSIVQTPDGYLWLGTEFGLLRFDGVRTVPFQPPANERLPSDHVFGLLVARDGSLWVGTDKGLATWMDGRLARYEQFAGSFVRPMLQDRDGAIWVTRFTTAWSLCEIQDQRVACYGEDGGPGAGALGLFEDRKGTLWVGTTSGVWRWKPGVPAFHPLPRVDNGVQAFAQDRDGSLLIGLNGGVARLIDGQPAMAYPFPTSMHSIPTVRMLRDRDGGIWAGTTSRGLVHVHDGVTNLFSRTDGLSGDGVGAIFEDREGSIWVATLDGLDRFRKPAAVVYSANQGLSSNRVTAVYASRDGGMWVGTAAGLNRWRDGRVTVYREGLTASLQSIFEDSQGRVWVSTSRGVGYLHGARVVPVQTLPGGTMRAIVEDRRKTLWIAISDRGLFHLPNDAREAGEIRWDALSREDPASAVTADPAGGGLWVGFYRGGVAYFADGHVRASYGTASGLADGKVSSLYVDPRGTLWVAADGGLSRVKDGRVTTATSRNGLPCDNVGWVLEDARGSLWLGMACGLAKIARDAAVAWDGTESLQTTLLDVSDGVRMFTNASYHTAPAAVASDGRIWFVSPDGVSVIDPEHLPFNTLPPPLQVEQVIADRKVYLAMAGSAALRLPPLTHDVEIDYTALSFVAPEKLRFRYKLEGRDQNWQDVGTRRQAFYNDLRPGSYRFRVVASNNSGVWNEDGASLDFSVAPAYYQTGWFIALSVVAVVAVAFGAHRIRLRIVEKHEQEISALNERLMKAQEQERIRIAGELHDGVMQEMLAVTMLLGTAKRRIPDESAAKGTIDKIQDKMLRLGTDIRRLSHDLHPPVLQEAGLPQALQVCCEEFSAAAGIPVYCEADDRARDLSRGAALALFRIVQEALGNAAKHARATQISVRLTRSDDRVLLTISDDGVGFDAGRLGAPGGLGLVMMRERATQLNGTFEFDSAPGRGTTINVIIPFR